MLKSQKTMLALSEKRQKQTELAEKVNASADGATEEPSERAHGAGNRYHQT